MKFKLQITNGYDIKIEGVEATKLLSQFGINDNYVAGDGSIILCFNKKEVENSKLLNILFKSTNKAYLYNSLSKENRLNELIDIKKIYEYQHPSSFDIEQRYDKDQRGYFLKNNAKEIFYRIFNSIVDEKIYIFNNIQNGGIAGYIKKGIFETPEITLEKAGLFGIDNLEDWKKFLSKINSLYPDKSEEDKQELDKLKKGYTELQKYVEKLKFDIPKMLDFSDDAEEEKGKSKKYFYEKKDFNGHEWIRFYEDEEGQANVEWAEGCHDRGLGGLENFENRVEEKYGKDKESVPYRFYMVHDDLVRLAMNLPARKVINTGKICNLNYLLKARKEQIKNWLNSQSENNFYLPKNKFWFSVADRENATFLYLDDGIFDENDFYYDLVTVEFEEKQVAIPVPILAEALNVQRKDIYYCFPEGKRNNRNEIEFI